MASIVKKGGAWHVRWRSPGGAQRSRRCPTAAAARELQREVEHTLALGRDWAPRVEQAPAALLDVAEAYLRAHAASWGKRTLRVRTDQLAVWERACAELGASTAADLSRSHLADYLAWLQRETGRHGRPRAASTSRRYVALVELVWAWAHEWADERGWGGQVPPPRRVTPTLQRPRARWRPAATWAELAAMIAAAEPELRGVLLVEALTGLRVGQVLALQRRDLWVDEAGAWLTVRPELGKTDAEQAGREVPCSRHLLAWAAEAAGVAVDGWRMAAVAGAGLPLVPFPRRVSDARDREQAAAAWLASGARPEVWTGRPHHAIRAAWMSSLLRDGAALPAVEMLVGHAPTPTAPSYIDPTALPLRQAVDLVPDLRRLGGW